MEPLNENKTADIGIICDVLHKMVLLAPHNFFAIHLAISSAKVNSFAHVYW